jgi:hypothetical protein
VSVIFPLGGPQEGGTGLTVWGGGFADLGGLRCLLGAVGPAAGTLDAASGALRCAAPPTPQPEAAQRSEGEVVRVSLNGQQYSAAYARFGAPQRPLDRERYYPPAFTYYNVSRLRLSSVSPAFGPRAGGTAVTITGAGFVHHGAPAVAFVGDATANVSANVTLAPATLAFGEFGGQVLRCVAPAWAVQVDVSLELTLNGDAGARTRLGEGEHAERDGLRYRYVGEDDPQADRWRVHEEPSPPPAPSPPPPREQQWLDHDEVRRRIGD